MLGGILIALGHFFMAFYFESDILGMNMQSINSFFFYAALALLIVGNGFKPNISTMVGLIPRRRFRRDYGYYILYRYQCWCFSCTISLEWLGYEYGWHVGFGAAGVGMLAGLAVFIVEQN